MKVDAMLFSILSSPSIRAQQEPRCKLPEKRFRFWPLVLAHSS